MPVVGQKAFIPKIETLTVQNVAQELAKANLGKTLSKVEAKWVSDVFTKFGADAAVKDSLTRLLDGVKVSDPTSLPAALKPANNSIGTQTGGLKPQNTNTLDVVHFQGASTYESDFKFKPGMLKQWYGDVPTADFGTTKVNTPAGSYQVHDMQYDLGNGKVGMRFIPVADAGGTVVDKAGKKVPGNTVMDAFLRKEMGLTDKDPIYALLAYVHPETWQGDMKSLGGDKLKTEMANTHLGAYLGESKTSNSPEGYHNHSWEVTDGSLGYPCNVTILSMQGVPQATLNKNLQLVDSTLNHGVEFPSNYKEDIFRTIDLPTTMMFYRDWIKDESYLKNDNSWKTYCAEHKTITGNVALNLPHNEAAFKEMFGATDGADLWKKFQAKFKQNEGRAFTAADETSFEPLWKKEGMQLADVQPWKDKAEYDGYNTARQKDALSTYTGRKPPEPGKGMMWPPETTADLMCDFVESYASFKQAGGFGAAAAIMGFKDTITTRMGMTSDKFLAMTVPVVNKMMIAEAMATAPGTSADAWLKKASATLFAAFGGAQAPAQAQPQIQGLVDACLTAVKAQINNIAASPMAASPEKARDGAHKWLRDAIQLDVEKARRISVSDSSKVEFYSPPAVVNRVVLGMHEHSQFVSLRTVCTAIEGDHMEPK